MENAEYLVIYKGDDTDFTLNQSVYVDIHTETSLEGLTAVFRFHNFKQSFSPIPEDKRLKLSIPKCASDRFPLGFSTAKVEFIDSEGNVRTVCSQLRVLVTKFVTQAYYNPDHRAITVNFSADVGTDDYNELKNKPQINGVEVKGSLSLDDLGAAKGNARALPPYLHEMAFDDSYKADAEAWYESHSPSVESGACSACYKNGKLGRRYDWQFDSAAEFVVRMSEGKNEDGSRRYASVGVASLGNELTEEMVVSGKYTDMYRVLPGRTVDGVNDAGVAVEVNVIPRSEDDPVKGEGKMHPWGVVRYVLDRFNSAEKAAYYIKDHYYIPDGNKYAYHWMIADKVSGAWIVEDGKAFKIDASAMTNFRVQRVAECMTDGKVDRAKLAEIDPYGTGTERWDVLAAAEIVEAALAGTKWTDLYVEGTEPVRLSDFAEVGYATVDETEKLEAARQFAIAKWAEGERESHRDEVLAPDVYWWQSVHVSVYDLENKTLTLSVQEEDKAFVFAVNAGGAGTSLDEKRNAVDYRALRRICDIWTWERVAADPSEGLVETPADFIEVANMTNAAYPEFNEVSSDWWYAGIYWPNGRFRYEATSGLAGSATTANLVYAFVSYDEEGHEIARFRAKATRDPSKVNDRRIEPPDAYGGNAFARIATTEWVHYVVEKAKGWAKALLPAWLTPDYAEPATVASVEAKVSKSGDTMTGKLIVQAASDTDTGFLARRNDTHWTEYKVGQINVRSSSSDAEPKATRILTFPDHGGEIALKEDIPEPYEPDSNELLWDGTSVVTRDREKFIKAEDVDAVSRYENSVVTARIDVRGVSVEDGWIDGPNLRASLAEEHNFFTDYRYDGVFRGYGGAIRFPSVEEGKVETFALLSDIPEAVTLDNDVTKDSTHGVKSSGIWNAVWGTLTSLPTGFNSLYDWCVDQLAGKLSLTGGTLTGNITLGNATWTGLGFTYRDTWGRTCSIKFPSATRDKTIAVTDQVDAKVGSFAAVGGVTPTVSSGVADVSALFTLDNTSNNLDNIRTSASDATTAATTIASKLDKSDVVDPHEATEKGKAADALAVQKTLSNKREKLDNAEYTGTVKQSWWKYGEAVINYEGKTGSYSFSWGANVGDKTIQIVYSSYNGSLIFKYLGGDTIGEAVIAAGLNPESLDEAVNNLGGPYVFGEHKFEFEPTRCCTYTPTGHRFAVGAKVAGTEEPFYADENGIIEIPVDVSDKRDQFDREWYTKDDENFAIYQWALHTEQPATLEVNEAKANANDLNLSATLDRVIRWNQTAHAWTDLQSIGTTYKITGVYENGEWKFALRVNGTDALIMEWSGFSVEKTVDGTLYKVSAEIRKFALTRDDVPWVNEKSIVVGTPKDDKTNGDSTMAVGFRCYNLAVKSVAFGNEASTVKDNSMAVGNNSQANGVSSVALGHNACTGSAKDDIRASHDRAFCWNGQNLTGGQYYFSKGAGTFCINPDGGLAGTYVGDKKLSDCFAEKVGTASVQTPSESSTIDEVASAKGTWDLLKAQGVHFKVVTTESGENELKITLGQPNS